MRAPTGPPPPLRAIREHGVEVHGYRPTSRDLQALERREHGRTHAMTTNSLESAAHIVQLALTPVFLFSGIAALLNVFSTRLGRVADQADRLSQQPKEAVRDARLRILRWRSRSLDWAVLLAALGGAFTCGAVLALFLGEVRGSGAAALLFFLFGGAIVLTMGALVAFVVEMLLAANGVRRVVDTPQWRRTTRPSVPRWPKASG
jgi:hypothetical protein